MKTIRQELERLVDLTVGVILMAVLSPTLVALVVLTRLFSPAQEVFVIEGGPGFDGCPRMYRRFRMPDGNSRAFRRLMETYSLNCLPEIFGLLLGEISWRDLTMFSKR